MAPPKINQGVHEEMCCACTAPTLSPTYSVAPTMPCYDTNDGALSAYGYFGCSDSDGGSPGLWCSTLDDDDYTATDMCCSCGGGSGDGRTSSSSNTPSQC